MTEHPTAAILADLWNQANLRTDALARAHFIGQDPVLPSSFKIGAVAQATIGAAALAATEIDRLRTQREQTVCVDARHAAIEFRSERYLRIDGTPPPELWDRIAGLYRTGDDRWVRLHTNFPHHRDGVVQLLNCANNRESVQAALLNWQAERFEDAAAERGLVVTMLRTREEWIAHAQGQAIASLPLFTLEKIGDAPPEPKPAGDRPLSGVRVLDLTRIIAGPVCGRALAAHGADVLRVTSPELPFVAPLVMDAGRGKRSAFINLKEEAGRDTLQTLLQDAEIFVQGYRPGGMASHGFAPEDAATVRPGIVYVTLSAYGHRGPWAGRRGFDSLVQTASGINYEEGLASGHNEPRPLPCQALDHASGYLMAFAALAGLHRRMTEGGSWHIRVALAHTGHWLCNLGRVEGGFNCPDPTQDDIVDYLEERDSGFGRMLAVKHAAHVSDTPAGWTQPSTPLGVHEPIWAG